ncbi:MAG: hypothetical protein R8M14_08595 [Ghiorsea sp.]
MRYLLVLFLFTLASCSESVEPAKIDAPHTKHPYEKNAVDTVGVAKGSKQISPNGRPAY